MSLALLTGIKTWFAAASVGVKVGVVATGVVVAASAVATPIVIISSQTNNNETNVSSNGASVSTDLNGGQELSAEQQAYCENMLNYMANNNGKVPDGENREEVVKKCYGESNNTASSHTGTTTFISLEEASKTKWEAEHCEFVRYDETTFDIVCDAQRPWELPSNLTTLYELQLQYCSDWDSSHTQTVGITDCAAHGASWVDELVYELSNKSDWTGDMQVVGIDPYALLEPLPNTEHGYKLYEGDSNLTFPTELLRKDCTQENDTSWICPTVVLKGSQ